MVITDEMMKKANRAITDADAYSKDFISETGIRAALEAVAPMLIAQGMREAAEMLPGGVLAYFDGIEVKNRHCNPDAEAILARAQELDPK